MKEVYLINYKGSPLAVIDWSGAPDPKTIGLWYATNYAFFEKDISVYPIRLPLIDTERLYDIR